MSRHKNQIKNLQASIARAGKKVDRMHKVVEGFNFLLEKKAVEILPPTVRLYRELIGYKLPEMEAWMKNAYFYSRTKLDMESGAVLYFKDIETDEMIGSFDGKTFQII